MRPLHMRTHATFILNVYSFKFHKEQLPAENDVFKIMKLKTFRFNNKVLHFKENEFRIRVWQIGASKEKYVKCGLASYVPSIALQLQKRITCNVL